MPWEDVQPHKAQLGVVVLLRVLAVLLLVVGTVGTALFAQDQSEGGAFFFVGLLQYLFWFGVLMGLSFLCEASNDVRERIDTTRSAPDGD